MESTAICLIDGKCIALLNIVQGHLYRLFDGLVMNALVSLKKHYIAPVIPGGLGRSVLNSTYTHISPIIFTVILAFSIRVKCIID